MDSVHTSSLLFSSPWPFILASQLLTALALLFHSCTRRVGLGIFIGLALGIGAIISLLLIVIFLSDWPPFGT